MRSPSVGPGAIRSKTNAARRRARANHARLKDPRSPSASNANPPDPWTRRAPIRISDLSQTGSTAGRSTLVRKGTLANRTCTGARSLAGPSRCRRPRYKASQRLERVAPARATHRRCQSRLLPVVGARVGAGAINARRTFARRLSVAPRPDRRSALGQPCPRLVVVKCSRRAADAGVVCVSFPEFVRVADSVRLAGFPGSSSPARPVSGRNRRFARVSVLTDLPGAVKAPGRSADCRSPAEGAILSAKRGRSCVGSRSLRPEHQ